MALNKTRVVKFLCTPDEFVRLKNKSEYAGFVNLSQFCRFMLFNDFGIEKKIQKIYERIVIENGGEKDGN